MASVAPEAALKIPLVLAIVPDTVLVPAVALRVDELVKLLSVFVPERLKIPEPLYVPPERFWLPIPTVAPAAALIFPPPLASAPDSVVVPSRTLSVDELVKPL